MATVQTGSGASAPLHLELDPSLLSMPDGPANLCAFVRTFFKLGGTQVIINFVSRRQLEQAIANPGAYRDLVVRATGFIAYFVNLDHALYPEILSRYD